MLVKARDVTDVRSFDKIPPFFTGLLALKDGRIALSDYQSARCVCMYHPDETTLQRVQLTHRPYSVAVIQDENFFVVTQPYGKCLSIITNRRLPAVRQTLKTQDMPASIVALSNGRLAVSWFGPPPISPYFSIIDVNLEISVVGTDTKEHLRIDQDTSGRKFKSFWHLAVDEGRKHVVQPCWIDRAVYCFNLDGEPVFKYSHPELIDPRGVAIDKSGNIYVCPCVRADSMQVPPRASIHVMSPAGEPISIVTEGIPTSPRAICLDSSGSGLWVSNTNESSQDVLTYYKLQRS